MIVVSDTTPLSELAKVGKLDILRDVFGEIIIPQEVYNEVTRGNHPAVSEVESITWISVRTVIVVLNNNETALNSTIIPDNFIQRCAYRCIHSGSL